MQKAELIGFTVNNTTMTSQTNKSETKRLKVVVKESKGRLALGRGGKIKECVVVVTVTRQELGSRKSRTYDTHLLNPSLL